MVKYAKIYRGNGIFVKFWPRKRYPYYFRVYSVYVFLLDFYLLLLYLQYQSEQLTYKCQI